MSSSKGVAYCNLCPPNTSFWTSDGSVSRRKVGVSIRCDVSPLDITSLFLKVLASSITIHMKLRHPDAQGWAPWGSAVSLQCKFCAFATYDASQWATHLNECKRLIESHAKENKTSEDRDEGMGRTVTGQHSRRSEEGYNNRRSRSPRRTWSPRREPCPWGRGSKRPWGRSGSNSRSRAVGDWRSDAARRSLSPGDVCKICGEKFEGHLSLHLAAVHQDLSFR